MTPLNLLVPIPFGSSTDWKWPALPRKPSVFPLANVKTLKEDAHY